MIAIANQKGGVGKSTTAVSLGAALAELGFKVLVVDLDPQGNASTGLGIRHESRVITVYDVLAAEAPIEGAIIPTPVEGLYAIPSTIDLAGAEIELVSQFSRELRLRKALEPLKADDFDFMFLDCPPSLGLLTVNALAAADELIVPIQCEYYALEGLGQLLRNVRLVQQNVNTGLRLTGIVMTMFDPRTKLSEQVVQEVRKYFGERVYRTVIPRTVRLSEAPGFGQPITVYDPKSRGAECYRDLAREVAEHLPLDEPMPIFDEMPSVNLPRPQQAPKSAPRPLVLPDDDVEAPGERVAGPDEELAAPDASSGGEVEGVDGDQADVGPSPEASPIEVESQSSLGEPSIDAQVEGTERWATPSEPRPGGSAPAVEASREEAEAWLHSLEAEAQAEAQAVVAEATVMPIASTNPRVELEPISALEGATVVRIGEGSASAAHATDPPAQAEEEEPKKRWGLFRRGGGG